MADAVQQAEEYFQAGSKSEKHGSRGRRVAAGNLPTAAIGQLINSNS